MRATIILVLSACAVWLALEQPVSACSCVVSDPARDYEASDTVARVRVVSRLFAPRGERRYLAVTHGAAFKGCLSERSWVIIKTASDSAACGVDLRRGSEYLIHARDAGRRFGLPLFETGLCSGNAPWDEVTPEHQAFLDSRYVCCGDDCHCYADNEVDCLADPCETSQCTAEGAVCRANYCGGCNAEWTDPAGALVCQGPASEPAACDDPDRRYVADSPEACQTVRFSCGPGETSFFDDCGCGCVAQHPTVNSNCKLGGCSRQLCLDATAEDAITTCEVRPEYACYAGATCEPQAAGSCAWTSSPELAACITTATAGTP